MNISKVKFKSIIFIFVVLLIIQIKPQTAHAFTSGDYEYALTGSNAVITKYNGSESNIAIPETINGYTVTGIGDNAFSGTNLISVIIPDSVIQISSSAFSNCYKLTEINVGAGNTRYSSLDGVLYNKLKTTLICYPIGKLETAFIVPGGVTSIEEYGFLNCKNLTKLTFPDSLQYINGFALAQCTGIRELRFWGNAPYTDYFAFNGWTQSVKIYYLSGNTGFSDLRFNRLKNSTLHIFIVAKYYGNGNTSGTVPVDSKEYEPGEIVTVLENSGLLTKAGYTFVGWSGYFYRDGAGLMQGTVLPGSTFKAESLYYNSLNADWKQVTGITITSPPEKTEYVVGQSIDLKGMVVTASCLEGVTVKVPVTIANISGFDTNTVGSQKVSVTVDGKTATFEVNVIPKALIGIEITTPPAKTEYVMGQSFDPAGMVVTAAYNDGSRVEVTGYSISPLDALALGTGKVTISYEGKTVEQPITVEALVLTVTFESDRGSEVASITADYNSTIIEPTAPTKAGYTFGGWYKEAACENAWDFTYDKVTSDITLYAKWTPFIEPIRVSEIKLDTASLKLGSNGTYELRYIITPSNATNQQVEWTSSNESAVSVDDKGNVKAVGKGDAIITAATVDGNKTAACNISVIPVENITISKTSLTMKAGYQTLLKATIYPSTAVNKNIIWESSDTDVAVVDDKGYVTFINDGEAIIYAKSDDDNNIKAECKIKVETPVTSVKLNTTKINLSSTNGYNKVQLTASVLPDTAGNKSVTWESSNENVAKVDSNGMVTAVGDGKATITARTESGNKIVKCSVTVSSVTGIKISKAEMSMKVGASTVIKPTITPSSAAVKDIKWEVTSGDSVIITNFGKVMAVKAGTSVIKATTLDGGKSAEVTITVTGETLIKAESLVLTNVKSGKNEGMLLIGKTGTIKAILSGENKKTPTNRNLLWTSSDESVAIVDDNGKVTARATGKVTITASTIDGSGIEASVNIEVVQPITTLMLDRTLSLSVGEEKAIAAVVLPEGITQDGITILWSKSDKNNCIELTGASILQKGESGKYTLKANVKALNKGSATVTLIITTKDGTYKKVSCVISIK